MESHHSQIRFLYLAKNKELCPPHASNLATSGTLEREADWYLIWQLVWWCLLCLSLPPNSLPYQQEAELSMGRWYWILASDILLEATNILRSAIQDIHLQLDSEDQLVWKSHLGQVLTFKEAWQLTRSSRALIGRPYLVWNSLLQRRVSFFAWRSMHCKTPIQAWAQSVGFSLITGAASAITIWKQPSIFSFTICLPPLFGIGS